MTNESGTSHHFPMVTAIVLNWNNLVDSAKCIESLLESDYQPLRIVCVDNNSKDGSYEQLRVAFPFIDFIRNAENLGFSRGCNVGIRLALAEPECGYVLLINNDCTVARSSIGAAVREAEGDASIGVVTGKVLDEHGQIWHAGGTISLWKGQSRTRGFREIDRGQFDFACDTDWATGALMLVSRVVADRVGLLPEEYFFGVEEWDYSIQVRRAGFRIRYLHTFVGVHPGGGSHDNHDPKFAYNYYRNKLIFQEKHLGKLLFQLWLLPFRLYLAFRMRAHISHLARITYANPSDSPVDDVVFAAWSALHEHGSGPLNERTMLDFQERLKNRQRPGAH